MNELDFSEIARLSEKYNKDPKSRIFVQLADLYRKNNMLDEALDVLNKGFEYHPEYPVAYLILGKCYYDKRSYIQARDAFEKTIALDPQNIVALRMLAKTCEILKDERGQINAYKSIIGIDPMDTTSQEKLSMLEALQRKEPMYTVAMAEEYEKQGNLEESLKIYENLLFTDPSDLLLNQKVAELKKTLSEQKKKLEEEKIEDMQVERVFKGDEPPEDKSEEVEISQSSTGDVTEQGTTGESEIQSLEDFLVEELEQAAEKVAAEPQEVGDVPLAESPTTEPEPAEEATIPTTEADKSTEDVTLDLHAQPKIEEKEAAVTPPVDISTEDISETTEKPLPIIENEYPIMTEEQASVTDDDTEKTAPTTEIPPLTEEPAVPTQTTPTDEIANAEPSSAEAKIAQPEPEAAQPEATPTSEVREDVEKKEEPKPSKEEDFKSFQEWLSGLLK
jgi:tetratricopeptide (TPR) repeat protein